ncbi:MAG: hypothetical protein MMC23_004225 [Stictis urceolatum]|nr:hypothetical protein [Stictis urceolata]
MNFLKSAVASAISQGPPFPYSFGDRVDLDQSIWTLHNGTKREDGSNCSIFSFDITTNKSRLPIAQNALRKLKTLRHPGILKVLDTVETETYIYIATERVTPLGWHVRRKSLSPETSKWGLFTIASTLKFINEGGVSVHGNIRVSSIFTSESGEWRLGGLDILSSMKEDNAVIYSYAGAVPDINRYAPPEVSKGGWETIKRNPLPAVDAYDFGLLIFEVFDGGALGMDSVGQTKNIPPSMHQPYKRLLNANPKARLTTANFLDQGRRIGGFFDTSLIRLSEGIESMGLKSDGERQELLNELDEVADDFPEEFFKMKILPELLKSVEFGGGGPKVFGYVMKIGSKLSDDEYEARLNPFLVRLFANPDRQVRVVLLENLPQMIDHFPQKLVSDKVFPQIATGFTDVAPLVREQTVKAVLTIITKLADRTINGELLKLLARTANDEQPGIRTNTTICLGKIARNLGPHTRGKVLIAAFTRSLRDPFVHARNASLQALAATADLFSEEDAANKMLPAICPSLIDKEKIVRDQANKCFDTYMSRIRRYATTLPESTLPPPTSHSGTTTPRMDTPTPQTGASEGWTGWAISSFTNKMAAASGEISAKPIPVTDGLNPSAPALNRTISAPQRASTDLRPHTSSASNLHRQALTSPSGPPPLIRTSTDSFFNDAQQEDDALDAAWGDMDDDPDSVFHTDAGTTTTTTTSASASTTTSPPPSARPKVTSTKTAPPVAYDDGGEPDFAGWLNARSEAKAGKALPKGIGIGAGTGLGTKGSSGTAKVVVGGRKIGGGVGAARKVEEKKIDIKPKEEEGEDGWGDAWD